MGVALTRRELAQQPSTQILANGCLKSFRVGPPSMVAFLPGDQYVRVETNQVYVAGSLGWELIPGRHPEPDWKEPF